MNTPINAHQIETALHKLKTQRQVVVVESPFASTTPDGLARNIAYARAALRDCLLRGEAPFASHLLYTQDGVLDDTDPAQRRLGIEAGLLLVDETDRTVVYTDLGISRGMAHGVARAEEQGRPVEYRTLPGWRLEVGSLSL